MTQPSTLSVSTPVAGTSRPRSGRRRAAVFAFALAAALSACHIADEWHYAVGTAGLTMLHVAAASANGEFLVAGDYNGPALQLFSAAHPDQPMFRVTLPAPWNPVAGSAWRTGAAVDPAGRDAHSEAFLVLHSNGYAIPWVQYRGALVPARQAAWTPPPPTDASILQRTYIDVAQAPDGAVYVAANETVAGNLKVGRVYRYAAGAWTHTSSTQAGTALQKISEMTFDCGTQQLVVADAPADHVRLNRYDAALAPAQSSELPASRSLSALESFYGFTYMSTRDCTDAACATLVPVLSFVSPSGMETERRQLDRPADALALELPPLPLDPNGDTTTVLWHVGADKGLQIHKYRLEQ